MGSDVAVTVPIPAQVPAAPVPAQRGGRWVAGAVALLALGVVMMETATGFLPDGSVVWVVTPLRLVLVVGLVAALVAGEARWPRSPVVVAAAGVVLAAALATVASGQDWSGWRGVLSLAGTLVLAAAVGRMWSVDSPPFGLLALGAVAVTSGVAVGQSLNRTPTGFCRAAPNALVDVCGPDALVRAVGTFSNPNLLGAFLVLMLPLAAAGSAALADRGSRLIGTLVIVLGMRRSSVPGRGLRWWRRWSGRRSWPGPSAAASDTGSGW